jgi:hypothetical protein
LILKLLFTKKGIILKFSYKGVDTGNKTRILNLRIMLNNW